MKDILNKRVEDLTVSDHIKIELAAAGIAAGITALFIGGAVAVDKIQMRRMQKKHDKLNNIIDTKCEEN